jgi:hypothetical protein
MGHETVIVIEVKDSSVDEPMSDTLSETEITGSDSDSSVDVQSLQWVEIKNSGLKHSTKHISMA